MYSLKQQSAFETIKCALAKAKKPFVAFSGGKNSLVVLHMVRTVAGSPVNTLFIDTSAHFKEIYKFIEKMSRLWGLNLIKDMNYDGVRGLKIAEDPETCCRILKREVVINAVKHHGIDCLFTGAGSDGKSLGERSDMFLEVQPLANFTDDDIWDYIHAFNLPFCSLYRKGFKSISCQPCTAASLPDSGEQEKSRNELLARQLKNLGYL